LIQFIIQIMKNTSNNIQLQYQQCWTNRQHWHEISVDKNSKMRNANNQNQPTTSDAIICHTIIDFVLKH
jgi:hypothetical protein